MTSTSPDARVLRGTLVNAVALAAGAIGSLFLLLVARLLGEAALGAYALAWASADLLAKLSTLGLDQSTVAVVAERQQDGDGAGIRAVFRKALAAGMGASLLAAAVAWMALAWAGPRGGTATGMAAARSLMLLAVPGVVLYRVSNGVSRGLGIMKHDILSGGLAQHVSAVVLLVALVAAGLPAAIGPSPVPVLAAVGGFTLGGLVAYVLARNAVRRASGGVTAGGNSHGLLRRSSSIGAAGLVNLLLTRMDVLVLGALVGRAPGLSAAAFGVYCAAAEVAGVSRKVRQAVDAPLLHALASGPEERSGTDRAAEAGSWVLKVLLLIAGCLSLGAPLVLALFGPAFESGALWLVLLVAAQAVYSYSGLAEAVALVRRPTLNLASAVLTAFVYLGLCTLLVPRVGATGAALAALTSFTVLAWLRFGQLSWILGRPWPWRRARTACAMFLIAGVPAAALRWLVPGRTGAGLAVGAFLALYVATGLARAFSGRSRWPFAAAVRGWARPGQASHSPANGPLAVILFVSSEDDGGAARSAFLARAPPAALRRAAGCGTPP